MRIFKIFFVPWVWTILGAALLLVFVYLGIGWIVDGYLEKDMVPDGAVPDSWNAPDTWAEWRDITIVAAGFLAAVALLLTIILLMALLFLVVTARRVLLDNVRPALDSLRDALDNVRGTTEFASETLVTPIIRVYSLVRGLRRGLGAVKSAPGFMRRSKED